MSGMFAVANDATICSAIKAARHSVVYAAPGITEAIVEAIAEALEFGPDLQVTLIIDLDPEVYRLGYGTEGGLRALQALAAAQHLELRQQEGLRIGVLVTDGASLVYAPTPLLIEAGSESQSKPNALCLTQSAGLGATLMHACAANGASGDSTPPPSQAEIGKQAALPEAVAQSLKSLDEVPPKSFDVARVERVFESKIQFVELELTGYRLSSKSITIPNELLVGEDKELKERLKNSFKLLQGAQEVKVQIPVLDKDLKPVSDLEGKPKTETWSEAELERQRKSLYEDFLISVPRFGQVIMRRHRAEFDYRVALLKTQIAAFRCAVEEKIGESIIEAIYDLADTLLPRIRENLPKRYDKLLLNPTDDALLDLLRVDLERACGGLRGLFNPQLHCVFKDVTYESINDSNFRAALSQAMLKEGGEGLVRQLFSEHDAAPEVAKRQLELLE